MQFRIKSFHDLNLEQLYRILQLRAEVFVVEQDCVYQDLDNIDQNSHHVLGLDDNQIEAYTRVIPPGESYPEFSSIGRVITSSKIRKKGYGKDLVKYSINACQKLYPNHEIKIGAQTYLLRFYHDLGFQEIGEEYLEDGIPHIHMIYKEGA